MTRAYATPDLKNPQLPKNTAAGVVTIEVATAAADGEGADWIKLTPRGDITTRDSRRYSFDPEALVARFKADGIDIPVDLNHSLSSFFAGPEAVAVGWVKELAARDDGLFGRVEWLEAGQAALEARTHRYISPTFHHDDLGKATWLHSAALVAAPALSMPAVASADPDQPETDMKALARALGLDGDATEAACLAAIATLQSDMVAKAVHDETLATLAATSKELDELKAANRKAEVDGLLEEALTAKKILPAQRDSYEKLCATDEGIAQVKALLAATPEGLKPSDLDTKKPPQGEGEIDPIALSAKAKVYQAEQKKAGVDLNIAEAVAAVREESQ